MEMSISAVPDGFHTLTPNIIVDRVNEAVDFYKTDMFFGFREGRVVDPFGNTWTISTRKENISHDEMQRRLDASFS
jgi:hypothetical protein